jgi:4-amino-4-deoxy-L-arabinose transferase-like glycosyltransferase
MLLVSLLLLAFALRVLGLTVVPPGWRDDEAIETTRHAQMVLDGQFPLYFIQAEGHEPIYHYVSAGWIALMGRSLFSVRLVSAFFGTLAVAAAFRLTRQLFGTRTALLVALLLAVSFWSLMYSRTKIRHIAELPFVLLAFSHLFKVVNSEQSTADSRSFVICHLSFAIVFTAFALYTYLAATTLLFILFLFGLYLLFTHYTSRDTQPTIRNTQYVIRNTLHASLLTFIALAGSLLLYLPLALAIRSDAERIDIVGGPLEEWREGNPQVVIGNTLGTLAMFGNTADNEALYNAPGRPVFGLVGFYFFVAGILIALSHWRDPRFAFLLIWLGVGIAPAFASNPPGSLSHTITALPVTYLLAVLPLSYLRQLRITNYVLRLTFAALLLFAVIFRDLPDYFLHWPADSEVRYLYRADLHELANELRDEPPTTYVLNGTLSKWDRVAFNLEGLNFESHPRWVNAEWAIVFPAHSATFLFPLADWQLNSAPPRHPTSVRFTNGLIFDGWTQWGSDVIAYWQVGPDYSPVEPEVGSYIGSPPFPAFAFLHLLDTDGALVGGSDRFDVDAYALQPGDRFLQRHTFADDTPPGTYTLEIGLYNPTTGERYLTDDGHDTVNLDSITLP